MTPQRYICKISITALLMGAGTILAPMAQATPLEAQYTDAQLGANLHSIYHNVAKPKVDAEITITSVIRTLKPANFALVDNSAKVFQDADAQVLATSCDAKLGLKPVRGALTLGYIDSGHQNAITKSVTNSTAATFVYKLPAGTKAGIYEFKVNISPVTGAKAGVFDVARVVVEVTDPVSERPVLSGTVAAETFTNSSDTTKSISITKNDFNNSVIKATMVVDLRYLEKNRFAKDSKDLLTGNLVTGTNDATKPETNCPRPRKGDMSDPYVSIVSAAFDARPGDVIFVRGGSGNYGTLSGNGAILMKRSGNNGKPIIFVSERGPNAPTLEAQRQQNVVTIQSSYIRFDGFNIFGSVPNEKLSDGKENPAFTAMLGNASDALPAKGTSATTAWQFHKILLENEKTTLNTDTADDYRILDADAARFGQNGIIIKPINGFTDAQTRYVPHHIEITNNNVVGVSGNCLQADTLDYLLVNGNTFKNCAKFGGLGGSGLSIFHASDTDQPDRAVGNDYINNASAISTAIEGSPVYSKIKFILSNNTIDDARTYTKWAKANTLCSGYVTGTFKACPVWSDGNGIIFDDNRNGQIDGVPYRSKSLIFNNVVSNSGGAGIQIFASRNVDVFHNTLFNNVASYTFADTPLGKSSGAVSSELVEAYKGYAEFYGNGVDNINFNNNIVMPRSTIVFNGGAAVAYGTIGSAAAGNLLAGTLNAKNNVYQEGRVDVNPSGNFTFPKISTTAPVVTLAQGGNTKLSDTRVLYFDKNTFVPNTGLADTEARNKGITVSAPGVAPFSGFLGIPPQTVDINIDRQSTSRGTTPDSGAVEN
jgi:hypothetical protein